MASPVVKDNKALIESCARLYIEIFGLWITTGALNTLITFDPNCDLHRLSCFIDQREELQVEAEQIHKVFHLLPTDRLGNNEQRDAIMAFIRRSPAFVLVVRSEFILCLDKRLTANIVRRCHERASLHLYKFDESRHAHLSTSGHCS